MNPSRPQTNTSCAHRSVADDGRLLCACIADADREVSPSLCQDCPAVAAGCGSLRFSLHKEAGAGILVRYGNGRSLVLDQGPTTLRLRHAACRITSQAISTTEECRACSLRRASAASVAAHPKVLPFPGVLVSQPAPGS
ncbi:MAG: hypothetical protein Q7U96_06905 [Chloroflexota bacterium]|nr:hypothetical protein [Chloroflexota bacterium]